MYERLLLQESNFTLRWGTFLSHMRYRIDIGYHVGTLFGQLTRRYSIKRVGTKGLCRLVNRMLRKVLSYTTWPDGSILHC